ncbi:hypothetical protein OHA37_03500 [Streptomyces sp. NBC_00335]|uniref:hypothetical protein n=1 Tax=unclassified Streptomyces TaxID=2593676 RepID=UPI00225723A6|nr:MULTISPECIES: hypothetical protein [unclassified Streptomyces]MCX5402950.1 hypothetical protein [Streptomyces sp. NBC_00086]
MTRPEAPDMDAPRHGAWLRTGISRNGGPLRETEHVVWLQTDTLYADSRGFAGTTSYDGHQITFHHHVGAPGHDVGVLRPDGVRLIETGSNSDGSTFMEVWSPLPYAQGPTGCWFAAGTQTVRVGNHVVHVDGAGQGSHHVLLRTDPEPPGPATDQSEQVEPADHAWQAGQPD